MDKNVMKTISLLSSALLLIMAGCTQYESARIENLRQPATIALTRPPADGQTYNLEINGHGFIDGESTITLVLNGEETQETTLKRSVNFTLFGEWEKGRVEIRYVPDDVKNGMLNMRYRFEVADDKEDEEE